MKKLAIGCLSLVTVLTGFAEDLEAVIVESDPGASTGEIDLTVTGGVAPFVFNWTGPDGFTSTDEDLTGLEAGIYTVIVTDSYCGVATLEVEVTNEEQVSINEDPIFELFVYPNPTSGLVHLQSSEVIDVVVFNVVGERVLAANNVTQIDLSKQPSGIYMLRVSSEKGVVTRKVTLQ